MKNLSDESGATHDLEIQLLGRFTLILNEEPLPPLASRKADAAIAYLALQNRPVDREQLAALLWSADESSSTANNLRVVLSNIRRDLSPYIQITRQTVEFNPEYRIQVDALLFREMVMAVDLTATSVLDWLQNPSAAPLLTKKNVHHLENALSLYTDHLLNGFRVLRAPDFEMWLTARQEEWRQLRDLTLDRLVMQYIVDAQYGAGLKWARQLVDDEPLNQEPQHKLITLLAKSGQNRAALEQYERYVKLLLQEVGAEPDAESVQLYRLLLAPTVRSSSSVPVAAAASSPRPPLLPQDATESALAPHGNIRYIEIPNNIRAPLTTFVGRENELTHIQEHLTLPARRLITLIGLGGMGKTRLAMQVAHTLITEPTDITLRYRDGIYFVPLAAIQSHTQLIPAIAMALNINLQGAKDAKQQVLGFLHYKHLLLILDNFEHLAEDAADELLDIVERAPNLVVLVTSRTRLQLSVEYLIPLQGLPYHLEQVDDLSENEAANILADSEPPTAKFRGNGANGADALPLDLAKMPAAYHLFADAATRTNPAFTLTQARMPSVRQICALISGVPLGIELAAALVDKLPCAEIAHQIERTLDALETTMRDVPLRHRSLRAVFEHSWSLLSAAEQNQYAQLAVFQHGFTADAAAEVASLNPAQLQSLVNKSLVQSVRGQNGQFARYEIHGVLLPYLAEKLAAQLPIKTESARRHSVYYANLLAQWNQTRQAKGAHNAIEIVQHESANLQTAWARAVEEQWRVEIEKMVEGLAHFYLYRGPFDEAAALFAHAVDRLHEPPSTISGAQLIYKGNAILSSLLSAQSAFLIEQGKHNEAIRLLEEAIALLPADLSADHSTNLARVVVLALHHWGKALLRLGRADEAQSKYADALQLAEAHDLRRLQARSLLGLGTVALLQGDYPLARQRYADALVLCRAIGDGEVESSLLVNLGIVHQYMGDYSQAKTHYESGLALERESGNRNQEALSLMNLGTLFHHVAAYEQAQFHYTAVLKIYQQMGKRSEECRVLANLALLLGNTGDHEGAERLSNRALTIARAVHQLDLQAYALTCLGHALTELENWQEALAAFTEAAEVRLSLGQVNFALEPKAGMAFVHFQQDDLGQAHALVDHILQEMACVGLAGVIEPNRIRWTCYQVLSAANDTRSHDLLQDAYQTILTQADKISEPEWRATFLENSPIRRAIIQAFEQRASG